MIRKEDLSYSDTEASQLTNEVKAIESVSLILEPLESDARDRVIGWAVARYMASNPSGSFEMGCIVREKVDAARIAKLEKELEATQAELTTFINPT